MKQLTEILKERFVYLHIRSCAFIQKIPLEKLYRQPRETNDLFPVSSCGEYILRSAGAVEQTFNGLTTKLWDDPFEWTLPEALFNNDKIIEYLGEVEAIRNRGFSLLAADTDLLKEIPAPVRLKTIFELLLETLAQAENFQGRAFATFRFFSDEKLPR
ncbi:MAG TPA: hypothetical protein VGB02_11945 [Pyrinomonadaceae bacterium]|jgi:hypothetical protein